ncbi:MAG: glycosyltransferase [Lachnospiraceae bacterium]|nr:glycosyltransferase [Lachnospiraceae bacterium]
MSEPLISVIVPVYNKELYVEECIKSILNQSFNDFEIICVDDHSPDRCGEILKRLADEDSRIYIITNEVNKGAGISRNIGLQRALGKYVLFLDADDFCETGFMETAYRCCEMRQLDILIYDYWTYDNNSGEKVKRHMPMVFQQILGSKEIFSDEDKHKFSFQICTSSSWIKMYNRQFIVENHITFQDISSANDVFFNQLAGMCAKRIGYSNCCWMNYRFGTTEQITSAVAAEHALNDVKAGIALKNEMMKRGLYEIYRRSFHTWIYTAIASDMVSMDPNTWETDYLQIKKGIKTIIGNCQDSFLASYFDYWYKDLMNLTSYDEMISESISNEYLYIFKYEKEKIMKIKKYADKLDYKIVLWGYGKNGRKFYQACEKCDFSIDCIVDKSFSDGHVLSPDVLRDEKCIILVTSAPLAADILNQTRKLSEDSKVVDIQSYLSYGIEFQKCIF